MKASKEELVSVCGERKRWKFIFISLWCFINKKIKKDVMRRPTWHPRYASPSEWIIYLLLVQSRGEYCFLPLQKQLRDALCACFIHRVNTGRRERRSPSTYWRRPFLCAENTEAGEPPKLYTKCIANVLSWFHIMCAT